MSEEKKNHPIHGPAEPPIPIPPVEEAWPLMQQKLDARMPVVRWHTTLGRHLAGWKVLSAITASTIVSVSAFWLARHMNNNRQSKPAVTQSTAAPQDRLSQPADPRYRQQAQDKPDSKINREAWKNRQPGDNPEIPNDQEWQNKETSANHAKKTVSPPGSQSNDDSESAPESGNSIDSKSFFISKNPLTSKNPLNSKNTHGSTPPRESKTTVDSKSARGPMNLRDNALHKHNTRSAPFTDPPSSTHRNTRAHVDLASSGPPPLPDRSGYPGAAGHPNKPGHSKAPAQSKSPGDRNTKGYLNNPGFPDNPGHPNTPGHSISSGRPNSSGHSNSSNHSNSSGYHNSSPHSISSGDSNGSGDFKDPDHAGRSDKSRRPPQATVFSAFSLQNTRIYPIGRRLQGADSLSKNIDRHKKIPRAENGMAGNDKPAGPSKKISSKREHDLLMSAGLSIAKSFPIGRQQFSSYNVNAGSNTLIDYIPAPFFRLSINNRIYLEGAFQWNSPQYTSSQLVDSSADSSTRANYQGYLEIQKVTLKKLYYTDIPLTIHYRAFGNLYLGAGLQYSRLWGGVAQENAHLQTSNVNGPTFDTLSTSGMIALKNNPRAYGKFRKEDWRFLLEADYAWRRFTLSLRYQQAFTPYLPALPDGSKGKDRNASLSLHFGYNIWERHGRK
ncbi:MAG: hypothetical protein P4L51_15930 [Puia sp.]|nr:hypothetical protein [Puia sp.]